MRVQAEQSSTHIVLATATLMAFSQTVYASTNANSAGVFEGKSAPTHSCMASTVVGSPTKATIHVIPDDVVFQALAAQWREDCGVLSSTTEMVLSPSYQRIIGLGPIAVPMILRQLEREGDQPENWFWALRSITGENPVSPDLRGNRVAMAKVWLEWAEQRYAW